MGCPPTRVLAVGDPELKNFHSASSERRAQWDTTYVAVTDVSTCCWFLKFSVCCRKCIITTPHFSLLCRHANLGEVHATYLSPERAKRTYPSVFADRASCGANVRKNSTSRVGQCGLPHGIWIKSLTRCCMKL